MKSRRVVQIALGGCLLISGIIVASWFIDKSDPEFLQGEVVVRSYRAASKIPGRIDTMYVNEGDVVNKGDLLYILTTPEISAKLKQAQAAKNMAKAEELKVDAGAREGQILAVKGVWEQAKAGVEFAQKSYARILRLYESGVIPAQKYDESLAYLESSKAVESSARAEYNMFLSGSRPEDKVAASALLSRAEGAVSEVEVYLSDAFVYAPIGGEISTIVARDGELVGEGATVVTLLDVSNMWVSFNVKETLLPRMVVGTELKGYVPALGKSLQFKVYYISVEASYATWSATKTRGGFDIKTFDVRARPMSDDKALRPGMSVLVEWNIK